MNRFVVGRSAISPGPPAATPRDGIELLALPRERVWAVGHDAEEWALTRRRQGRGRGW